MVINFLKETAFIFPIAFKKVLDLSRLIKKDGGNRPLDVLATRARRVLIPTPDGER
jgi:hypothetical protein